MHSGKEFTRTSFARNPLLHPSQSPMQSEKRPAVALGKIPPPRESIETRIFSRSDSVGGNASIEPREPALTRRQRIVGEWPALLSLEQFCEYLDICPTTFYKVCPLQPLDLGANVLRWSRKQADVWIASLPPRLLKAQLANRNMTQSPPVASSMVIEDDVAREERRAEALRRIRSHVRGKK
jgi:hypothetical protein